MDLNMRDGNNLGIALCHTYFGDMYREELNYDRALAEYEQAYAIMKDFSDNWHALNSLIALAGIWNEQGNFAKTKYYLDEGRRVATDIESNEHLADIYRLYSDMYRRIGDYRSALDYRDKSIELKAGLVDMDKVNRIQNTTLALERERQAARWPKPTNSSPASNPCAASASSSSLLSSCSWAASSPCSYTPATSACAATKPWPTSTRCANHSSPTSPTNSAPRSP